MCIYVYVLRRMSWLTRQTLCGLTQRAVRAPELENTFSLRRLPLSQPAAQLLWRYWPLILSFVLLPFLSFPFTLPVAHTLFPSPILLYIFPRFSVFLNFPTLNFSLSNLLWLKSYFYHEKNQLHFIAATVEICYQHIAGVSLNARALLSGCYMVARILVENMAYVQVASVS